MKLGIFGDSFAECSNGHAHGFKAKPYDGWTVLLTEFLNCNTTNHARGGTSIWWSFEKFIEHYKKYDTIIFVHSSFQRYPSVPKFSGKNELNHEYELYLHGDISGNQNEVLRYLSKYYDDFFPETLLKFLCKHVAFEIDNICKNNNIKLIQIFTESMKPNHEDYAIINPSHKMNCSRIFNFYYPGSNEKVQINNKFLSFHDILFKEMKPDFRACHFNSINNKLVTDHIIELLSSTEIKDKNFATYDWQPCDPIVDELYAGQFR